MISAIWCFVAEAVIPKKVIGKMADYRNAFTRIWSDSWFSELEPNFKLAFIYLFTNEHTTITGFYELTIRTMSFETGLDRDTCTRALAFFQQADKVYYQDGWVFVVNMQHYQASSSPKLAARIKADITKAPDGSLKDRYLIRYGYGMDTPSAEQDRAGQSNADQDRSEAEAVAEQDRSEVNGANHAPENLLAATANLTALKKWGVVENKKTRKIAENPTITPAIIEANALRLTGEKRFTTGLLITALQCGDDPPPKADPNGARDPAKYAEWEQV